MSNNILARQIASSINKPTQIARASKVTRLIEKPSKYMTEKVPINEIGKVKPVITVERHDDKNKNTINTVSAAPSTHICVAR
jgi:hypothetical protein